MPDTNTDNDPMNLIVKLSQNNIAAITVLEGLLEQSSEIDPDDWSFGAGPLQLLDKLEIYGPGIWCLYKDVCNEDLVLTHTCLRACHLGILSADDLKKAVSGKKNIDPAGLLQKVREKLPDYARAYQASEHEHNSGQRPRPAPGM